jgi:hypothetical protein
MRRTLIALALSLAAPVSLLAKNNDWPNVKKDCGEVFKPPASNEQTPPVPLWKRATACGTGFFRARPVHLTVKSIVPGGGFGPGLTFTEDFNSGKWQNKLESTGVSSFQAFWSTQSRFRATHDRFGKNNSARDRFALDIYANSLGLPHMPFYGIGPATTKANGVDFQERYVTAGVDAFNPFSSWFAAGGQIESIWPHVAGVNGAALPSITSAFTESTAPGLIAQPNLIHYEAYVEPRRAQHKFQFVYKVGYGFYQDHNTGHYTFRRFSVDGQHTFHPFGRAEDILTIHDHLTISDTSHGNVVPFYMQETLGGSNIYGQPTLRGFADYRFRAPDLALIQVEYDHSVS